METKAPVGAIGKTPTVEKSPTFYKVAVDNVHTSAGKFVMDDVLPTHLSASEIRLLGDKVKEV